MLEEKNCSDEFSMDEFIKKISYATKITKLLLVAVVNQSGCCDCCGNVVKMQKLNALPRTYRVFAIQMELLWDKRRNCWETCPKRVVPHAFPLLTLSPFITSTHPQSLFNGDLFDMTLVDEDTNSIPHDEVDTKILDKWCHLDHLEFANKASDAT